MGRAEHLDITRTPLRWPPRWQQQKQQTQLYRSPCLQSSEKMHRGFGGHSGEPIPTVRNVTLSFSGAATFLLRGHPKKRLVALALGSRPDCTGQWPGSGSGGGGSCFVCPMFRRSAVRQLPPESTGAGTSTTKAAPPIAFGTRWGPMPPKVA